MSQGSVSRCCSLGSLWGWCPGSGLQLIFFPTAAAGTATLHLRKTALTSSTRQSPLRTRDRLVYVMKPQGPERYQEGQNCGCCLLSSVKDDPVQPQEPRSVAVLALAVAQRSRLAPVRRPRPFLLVLRAGSVGQMGAERWQQVRLG